MMKFNLLITLCMLSLQGYGQNLFDDLVLYYSFENGQVTDGGPNGLDGVLMGPTTTQDRFGNNGALNFEPGQTVQLDNASQLEIQYPISFATWVLFDSDDYEDWSILRVDFQKDNYSGWYVNRFGNGRFGFAAGGDLGIAGSQNSRSLLSTQAYDIRGEWTHFAVVMEGPSNGKMYVNGCEITTTAGGTGPSTIVYTGNPLYIGRNDNSGSVTNPIEPDRFFDGRLDEMYIWNRLITEEEVQLLYDDFYTPVLSIEDQTTCEELSLSVTDSLTDVSWSNGSLGNGTVIQGSGTYTVQGQYDCFLVTDTFEVSLEGVAVDLGPDTSTCEGVATISVEGDYDRIEWSTGATTQAIAVDQSGTYSVTVTNACGDATDDIEVQVLNLEAPSLDPLYEFCVGDTVLLQLDAMYDAVSWSTGSMDNELLLSDAGQYSVTVTVDGCGSDTSIFELIQYPTYEREEDIPLCNSEPVIVNGVSYDQLGTYTQDLQSVQGCDSVLIINIVDDGCITCDDFQNNRQVLQVQQVAPDQYDIFMNQDRVATMTKDQFLEWTIRQKEVNAATENLYDDALKWIDDLPVGGRMTIER